MAEAFVSVEVQAADIADVVELVAEEVEQSVVDSSSLEMGLAPSC